MSALRVVCAPRIHSSREIKHEIRKHSTDVFSELHRIAHTESVSSDCFFSFSPFMSRASESSSLVVNGMPNDKGFFTDDASYRGNGFVDDASERITDEDGNIRTRAGDEISIKHRALLEFFGVFFWLFFCTVATVNNGLSQVMIQNAGVTLFKTNSTGDLNVTSSLILENGTYSVVPTQFSFLNSINGLVSINESSSTLPNPYGTFVAAIIWAGGYYLTLRALPGVDLIPWVTLNHFFFQWKKDGRPVVLSHTMHAMREAIAAVISQFAAGLAAIFAVYLVMRADTNKLGETVPSSRLLHDSEVILYEGIAAFLFMSLVNVFSRPRRDVQASEQAFFIAALVFMLHLCFGDLTGCAITYVRTISPALVRSIFSGVPLRLNILYYLIGQASGFFLAGVLAWFISKEFADKFDSIIKSRKFSKIE